MSHYCVEVRCYGYAPCYRHELSRWESLKDQADVFAGEGQFAEASKAFLAVLEGASLAPYRSKAIVYEALAQCALALEQDTEAVSYASQALLVDPSWQLPLLVRGRAQLGLGQFVEAQESLRAALQQIDLDEAEREEVQDDLKRAEGLAQQWQRQQDDKELTVGQQTLRIRQIRGTVDDAGERQGTGTVIWECGIVLAKYLDAENRRSPNWLRRKRVLELGSGTGVAGLAACALGANVCLTDVAEVLPLLQENVKLNERWLEGEVRVRELDWEKTSLADSFDIVLAADLVFAPRAVKPLVSLLASITTHDTVVLWCHKHRHDDLDSTLFQRFTHHGFACDLIARSLYDPDYSTDRISIYRITLRRQPTMQSLFAPKE